MHIKIVRDDDDAAMFGYPTIDTLLAFYHELHRQLERSKLKSHKSHATQSLLDANTNLQVANSRYCSPTSNVFVSTVIVQYQYRSCFHIIQARTPDIMLVRHEEVAKLGIPPFNIKRSNRLLAITKYRHHIPPVSLANRH